MRSASNSLKSACVLIAACAALAFLYPTPRPARAAEPAQAPPASGQTLTWQRDFTEANVQSRLSGLPLLAVAGLEGDPWCAAFEKTLSEPAVQAKLRDFVLYRFDLVKNPQVVRQLQVGGAPAAVILSPDGIAIAGQVGYMSSAEFVKWLDEAKGKAVLLSPQGLAGRKPEELLPLLAEKDPVLREAVIQALSGHADSSAAPVVKSFETGNLAARLGALELLKFWGAPVEGADPWKPETIAPALAELRRWLDAGGATKAPVQVLTEETARDLDLWMTAEDGPQTQAAYQRLARSGKGLLPRVRELLPPTWDRRRERIEALRYRLLLPDETALRHPQLPFQMAAQEPRVRLQALAQLSNEIRPELKDFFQEAFDDPDTKVREAALSGLCQTGAKFAKTQVVSLLADPSPDVRAITLKALMQSPMPEVQEELSAYATMETDEALVVHATQALRELRSQERALDTLLSLTEHKSWRVRAEAIEALGAVSTSGSRRLGKLPENSYPKIVSAMKRALRDQDTFVVAKAIQVLDSLDVSDVSDCLDELMALARNNTDLAMPVIELMRSKVSLRAKGLTLIKEFSHHKNPALRAAAIGALADATESLPMESMLNALSDTEPSVRTAAARVILDNREKRKTLSAQDRARLQEGLKKLAAAQDNRERFTGLASLAALGETKVSVAGLKEVMSKEPAFVNELPSVIHDLPWPSRKEIFQSLQGAQFQADAWGSLFGAVFDKAPMQEEEFLWKVFETDPHVPLCPQQVISTIMVFYGYESGLWMEGYESEQPRAAPAKLTDRLLKVMELPSPERRVIGLLLLCKASVKRGEEEALRLAQAPPAAGVPELVRKAATELLLCIGLPKHESLVLQALRSQDAELRKGAFEAVLREYSPFEPESVIHVGDKPVRASFLTRSSSDYLSSEGRRQAWEPPKLPETLSTEQIRAFLSDSDKELVLGAAYLLALRADSSGLPLLVNAWREVSYDSFLTKAVAQAVSAIGDDENVKYVREIYTSLESDQKEYRGPDLYWAIRRMTGPQAVELRKKMREEIGKAIVGASY